ncbi:Putative rhamnose biosynthetic enzyme 1 [Durusdinium trenchii]|uniref:Rhamnose biosynthetic enzyme 1 n=1 Tax=Durusdinium trenchii TaxID=1381693 RepID=A0ABP0MC48_9DINO
MLRHVEVFGGVGSISCIHEGWNFEYRRNKRHNIHKVDGVKIMLDHLVRVVPGGQVTIEPTCSSFLRFVSSATSRRTEENIDGDSSAKFVRCGNATCETIGLVIDMCEWLFIEWVLENPLNSLLFKYPPIQQRLQRSPRLVRIVIYLRTFGGLHAKPLELHGSPMLLYLLEIHKRAWHATKGRYTIPTMKKGARWVSGQKKAMATSSAYPAPLGTSIRFAHQCWLDTCVREDALCTSVLATHGEQAKRLF